MAKEKIEKLALHLKIKIWWIYYLFVYRACIILKNQASFLHNILDFTCVKNYTNHYIHGKRKPSWSLFWFDDYYSEMSLWISLTNNG